MIYATQEDIDLCHKRMVEIRAKMQDYSFALMRVLYAEREEMGVAMLSQATSATSMEQVEQEGLNAFNLNQNPLSAQIHYFCAGVKDYFDKYPATPSSKISH